LIVNKLLSLSLLGALVASALLAEVRALSFNKECQSLWLHMPIDNHYASVIPTGSTLFMKRLRSTRARTSLRHLHEDHIQASAAKHKLLTGALIAEALRIAMNRKTETLQRPDQIERDGQLAVTLAVIDAVDNDLLPYQNIRVSGTPVIQSAWTTTPPKGPSRMPPKGPGAN